MRYCDQPAAQVGIWLVVYGCKLYVKSVRTQPAVCPTTTDTVLAVETVVVSSEEAFLLRKSHSMLKQHFPDHYLQTQMAKISIYN